MQKTKLFKVWHKRSLHIILILSCFALSAYFALRAFNDNIVFYLAPSELESKRDVIQNKQFRLGGLVVEGSIQLDNNQNLEFKITDLHKETKVIYKGIIPNLFKENQGTVVFGSLGADGIFRATELLAKHDENYMPKEVADSLKKNGEWKGPNN